MGDDVIEPPVAEVELRHVSAAYLEILEAQGVDFVLGPFDLPPRQIHTETLCRWQVVGDGEQVGGVRAAELEDPTPLRRSRGDAFQACRGVEPIRVGFRHWPVIIGDRIVRVWCCHLAEDTRGASFCPAEPTPRELSEDGAHCVGDARGVG